ncbi:hypothetical protein LINPERHAP2_LOCUS15614, partial [Linum perenne]
MGSRARYQFKKSKLEKDDTSFCKIGRGSKFPRPEYMNLNDDHIDVAYYIFSRGLQTDEVITSLAYHLNLEQQFFIDNKIASPVCFLRATLQVDFMGDVFKVLYLKSLIETSLNASAGIAQEPLKGRMIEGRAKEKAAVVGKGRIIEGRAKEKTAVVRIGAKVVGKGRNEHMQRGSGK